MVNTAMEKENELYSYLACLAVIVFFSRAGEIFPFLASIHINLLTILAVAGGYLFQDGNEKIRVGGFVESKLITVFMLEGLFTIPFATYPTGALTFWKGWMVIGGLLFFVCLSSSHNEKQIIRMAYAIMLSSSLLVVMMFIAPTIGRSGRASVTMTYDPNDIALIIAVALPLLYFVVNTTKGTKRFCFYCLILLHVLALLKTGSRGGLLAFLCGFLIVFFSKGIHIKIWKKILILMFIGLFFASSQADNVIERWEDVISGEDYNLDDTSDAGGRLAIWKSGFEIFSENSIWGVGVANSSTAMGERFGKSAWKAMHNSYLQVALELGIVGFVIFIWMLVLIWRNCSRACYLCRTDPRQSLYILSYFTKLSLISFMIAAMFLSQAFSLIIPIFLALSNRIVMLAQLNCTAAGEQNE